MPVPAIFAARLRTCFMASDRPNNTSSGGRMAACWPAVGLLFSTDMSAYMV